MAFWVSLFFTPIIGIIVSLIYKKPTKWQKSTLVINQSWLFTHVCYTFSDLLLKWSEKNGFNEISDTYKTSWGNYLFSDKWAHIKSRSYNLKNCNFSLAPVWCQDLKENGLFLIKKWNIPLLARASSVSE